MPVVIEQTFPLGRFHATRWNQNPFEDRVGEWPPSPWRFIRTLAARWFQYQRETGTDNTHLRDELLQALAGELPSFHLPAQTWQGQDLRQYHPTQVKFTKTKDVPEVKVPLPTLALDKYRAVPAAEPVYWIWSSCRLSEEAVHLLRQLLRRIHYFGRAETWTIMQLIENSRDITINCELRTSIISGSVPVLAHKRDQVLDVDILLANTDDKRLSRSRIPAGTVWYHAVFPRCSKGTTVSRERSGASLIQVVRYALDSVVLPLVTDTLPVAEAARRNLMGIHGRLTAQGGIRGRSDVLSGKDHQGKRLINHRHAYYLPTDEDGDGRLDHLTVYAAGGFDPDERGALDRLRELKMGWDDEERHPLLLLLLGMGAADEYTPGPLRASKIWESSTPYVATRYAKTKGQHQIDLRSPEARATFLQEDLRKQLADVRPELAGVDRTMVTIEPLWDNHHVFTIASRWRPIQFKRFRRKAGDDGGRRLAGAFRLIFPNPVPGPLALGHSSHFGLGQFVPVVEDPPPP